MTSKLLKEAMFWREDKAPSGAKRVEILVSRGGARLIATDAVSEEDCREWIEKTDSPALRAFRKGVVKGYRGNI